MQTHGLYFPYIHIRDDNWLKTAALYWPTVRRLVPQRHQTHDSPTARVFAQAEVLRSEDPQALLATAGLDLLQALRANADELASRYRVVPVDGPAHVDHDTGRGLFVTWGHQHLGWVHLDKFPYGAVEMLVGHGLAVRGRENELTLHSEYDPAWSEHGYDQVPAGKWIGLHPAVAGAYMTALVGRFSELGNFQPITDQDDLRAAVPHRDVTEALQLLMGTASRPPSREEGLDRYITLSVQAAAPAHLSLVPPDKILECREKLQGELETFRDHVAKQADELAQIASMPVDHRRLETFNEHVEKHIRKPLEDLERGLALHRVPTTRTMLTASSFAAPASITAATNLLDQPVIALGAETVAAVGTAWWGVQRDRKRLRTESEVGYLLGVREQLTPKTLANRARKLWAGTY